MIETELSPEGLGSFAAQACDLHSSRRFVDGFAPDLGPMVMVVNGTGFQYSVALDQKFELELGGLRSALHGLFRDCLLPLECDLPCTLGIFEDGARSFALNFVLRRRVTERFPRTTFDLTVRRGEWEKLKFSTAAGHMAKASFTARFLRWYSSTVTWRAK